MVSPSWHLPTHTGLDGLNPAGERAGSSPVSCLLAPGCNSFSPPPPRRSLCPAGPGCWCCPNLRLQSSPNEALKRKSPLSKGGGRSSESKKKKKKSPATWEIGNEDDLSLVVQVALNLLELCPPGRKVHQQRHQPRVGPEGRPIGFHDVHARVKDPEKMARIKLSTLFSCHVKNTQRARAPLLEAVVDGHPDVKIDFGLGDVVAGQEVAEAGGVLLQHVPVVFPSAAVSEHLQQRRLSR